MKRLLFSLSVLGVMILYLSCSGGKSENMATGTFEATEILVSSEVNGRVLSFDVNEGDSVLEGELIGVVDTTQLHLKRLQLEASLGSLESSKSDVYKQIDVIRKQIETAEREKKRVENLLADGAATQKQYDDIVAQVELLKKQLVANESSLTNANRSIDGQSSSVAVQIMQVNDMLERSVIVSPISGTILGKYVEAGELTAQGRPLFKIADMDNVYMRAYLTSEQLYSVKIGDSVKVFADYGNGKKREYDGEIVWISEQSEFTPKTILTDDERANLVYAVKIAVKNDGYIKLGMYGEIRW